MQAFKYGFFGFLGAWVAFVLVAIVSFIAVTALGVSLLASAFRTPAPTSTPVAGAEAQPLVATPVVIVPTVVVRVDSVVTSGSQGAAAQPAPAATPTVAPAKPGASPDDPIPVGQWTEIAKGVQIRVTGMKASDSYQAIPGNQFSVYKPKTPGHKFYQIRMEGKFDGAPGESFRFELMNFHVLDRQKQVIGAQTMVDQTQTFDKTIFGGGSTAGEVVFIADKVTALYYQPWLKSGSEGRIFLAVLPQ